MQLDEFFDDEIEKEQRRREETRAELAEFATAESQQEQNRTAVKCTGFKQAVEETHRLLKPILEEFIQSANRKTAEGHFTLLSQSAQCKDTLYRYAIYKLEKSTIKTFGLFRAKEDIEIVIIYFGYNLYDTLFVVRISRGRFGSISGYTIQDVSSQDFCTRFAREIIEACASYIESSTTRYSGLPQ